MKPVQLPLFPELGPRVLPIKRYSWFHIANAHPSNLWKKQWWYPFKSKFLAKFASRDGYDLQVIVRTCWNCNGEGCGACTDGVYSRVEVPLERWTFPNGDVYHCPSQYLPAGRPGIYKHTFDGLIKHTPVTEAAATRAALKLFLRHDRSLFLHLFRMTYGDKLILAHLSERVRRIRWKIYCAGIRLHNRAATEDIPF